jgi:acyl-CoA thioester hydrolase
MDGYHRDMRGHAQRLPARGFEQAGSVPRRGITRLRVRYSECDPMNVAHHAAQVAWLEMGRTDLLRQSGVTYADLEREGIFLVITRLEMRYRRPVLYDDLVEVRTTVRAAGRVKIDHEYEVVVVERAGRACEEQASWAATTIACVDHDGRPRELPAFLQQPPREDGEA